MASASSSQQVSQPFRWHYAEFDDRDFQIRGRTLFFVVVLFSIVLLVTLLFLYARWICRFRPLYASASSVAQLPPPQPPQGLDSATINRLPVIVLQRQPTSTVITTVNELTECCICLGMFVDGDKVKVLPDCRHCFHCECVDKWLITHSSCPLCRASLLSDSVV